ncbi:MAG: dTMP kinase [Candidatus Omnitrophota bacterium]
MGRGAFITFEGSEGSGKSTHSKLLCAYLRSRGFKVIFVREPGSTSIGEKIRKILLDKENDHMTMETEMLLYMASRAQLVKEVILPALKARKAVICDRFLDSTLAYQGYGAGLDLADIKNVGRFATLSVKPDLTIFLDIDTKTGLSRTGKTKDRIEVRPISFHQRVRRGYLKLAGIEPGRIKVVRVNHSRAKTQKQIREFAEKILCRLGR